MLISQECKIAAKVRFFPHIRKKKTIYFSSAREESGGAVKKIEYSAGFFSNF